jgi:RHS repeat-associated protein
MRVSIFAIGRRLIIASLVFCVESAHAANTSAAAWGSAGNPHGGTSGDGSAPFTGVAGSPEAILFTGTAATEIPIAVPPGREKLTPQLKLLYASSNGRSPYGYGWTIPVSKIARATKDGTPCNCSSDHFVLDLNGNSSELSVDALGKFRPRIESTFLKIEQDTTGNLWSVFDRDGTKYTFGSSPNARVPAQNSFDNTFEWLLLKVEDFNVGHIDYEYTTAGAGLAAGLPQRISYGGAAGSSAIASPFEVRFVWETAYGGYPTVAPVSYLGGVPKNSGRRLQEIVTYSSGAVVRQYSLAHEIDPVSGITKLASVKLRANGLNNTCDDNVDVPSATFSYAPPLQRTQSGSVVGFHTGTIFSNPLVPVSNINLSDEWANKRRGGRLHDRPGSDIRAQFATLDINGDGLVDYVDATPLDHLLIRLGSVDASGKPQLGSAQTWRWPTYVNIGSGHASIQRLEPAGGDSEDVYLVVNIFDIDGDTLPELVDTDSANCALAIAAHNVTVPGTNPSWHKWCVYRLDVDSEGNPRPDSNGKFGFLEVPEVWKAPVEHLKSEESTTLPPILNSTTSYDLVDFDGDGRVDLLRRKDATYWSYYKNTGQGFVQKTDITAPKGCAVANTGCAGVAYEHDSGSTRGQGGLYDINGDGLRDFVYARATADLKRDLSGTSNWWVHLNTGNNLEPNPREWKVEGGASLLPNRVSLGIPDEPATIADLVDVTGDGLPDLVKRHVSNDGVASIPLTCSTGTPEPTWNSTNGEHSDGGTLSENHCWNLLLFVNTGSSFAVPVAFPSPADAIRADYDGNCSRPQGSAYTGSGCFDMMDFNGDGLVDIVGAMTGTTAPTHADWAVILHPASTGAIPPAPAQAVTAGKTKPNVLTSTMNGVGGVTSLTYAPSSAVSDGKLPFPYWVVTQVTRSDTFTPQIKTFNQYVYRNAYFDAEDREFRGFAAVRSIVGAADDDSSTPAIEYRTSTPGSGASTLTEFHQDDRRKGMISRRWTFGVPPASCGFGGSISVSQTDPCSPYHYLLNLEENCWEQDEAACCWSGTGEDACRAAHPPYEYSDSPPPVLLWAERSTPYRMDDSTTSPSISLSMRLEKRYQYDTTNGNRTQEVVFAGSGSGAKVATTNTTYESRALWLARNLVSRPGSVDVRDSRDQGRVKQATVFTYHDGTAGEASAAKLASTTACISGRGASCNGATTSFSYDAWGNLSKTESPVGLISLIEYDAQLHLYPFKMTDEAQLVSYATYDAAIGKGVATTSPNGHEVHTAYDGLGREIRQWTNYSPYFSFDAPQKRIRYVMPTIGTAPATCPGNYATQGQPGRIEDSEFVDSSGRPARAVIVSFFDGSGRVLGSKTLTEVGTTVKTMVPKQQSFDRLGNVRTETMPREASVSSVTVWNEPISSGTPKVTFAYDAHGRVTGKRLPDGTEVETPVAEPGVGVTVDANLHTALHPSDYSQFDPENEPGSARITIADALGRTLSTESCRGVPTAPDYSRCTSGESLGRTFYSLDALGRTTAVQQAVNPNQPDSEVNRKYVVQTAYDGRGLKTLEWDYNAGKANEPYGQTAFTYNAAGKPLKIKGNRSSIRYEYDSYGRVVEKRLKRIGARRMSNTYVYGFEMDGNNAIGRVSEASTVIREQGGEVIVKKTFAYTPDGLTERETTNISGGTKYGNSEASIGYYYDAAGRVMDVDYPALANGGGGPLVESVRTYWNSYGQAKCLKVVDPAAPSADCSGSARRTIVDNIDYDAFGQAINLTFGNGIHDYALFDGPAQNLKLRCRTTSSSPTMPSGCGFGGSDLQSFEYPQHDSTGRIREIVDLKPSTAGLSESNSQVISYDAAGRVIDAFYNANDWDEYEYDYLGNLLSHRTQYGLRTYAYGQHPHRAISLGGQSLTYDEDGARSKKNEEEYAYDAAGQLSEVSNSFGVEERSLYDESGNRVAYVGSAGKVHYFGGGAFSATSSKLVRYFSIGGRVIARDETTGSGIFAASTAAADSSYLSLGGLVPAGIRLSITDALVLFTLIAFVVVPTIVLAACAPTGRARVAAATAGLVTSMLLPVPEPVLQRIGCIVGAGVAEAQSLVTPSTYYLHNDHLGSVQLVTNQSAQVVDGMRYRVFGELRWSKNATLASARTFTGHIQDADSGFLYMGARHYDPETATFLTFDPARQYASPYTYAGNNPVGLVDPTGTFAIGIFGLFWGVARFASAVLSGADLGTTLISAASLVVPYVAPAVTVVLEMASEVISQAFSALVMAASLGTQVYGVASSFVNGEVGQGVAGAVFLAISLAGMVQAAARGNMNSLGRREGTPGELNLASRESDVISDANNDVRNPAVLRGMQHREWGIVPPPGVDLWANMRTASSEVGFNLVKFKGLVQNGGRWDYKQLGRQYEAFGNFHYGAVGRAAGIPEAVLLRAAGWAQREAGTSKPYWGHPWVRGGSESFGDDPIDQSWIKAGFRYYDAYMANR